MRAANAMMERALTKDSNSERNKGGSEEGWEVTRCSTEAKLQAVPPASPCHMQCLGLRAICRPNTSSGVLHGVHAALNLSSNRGPWFTSGGT